MTEKLSNDSILSDPDIRQRCRDFERNFESVSRNIESACQKAGRKPDDVLLLAATKTVPTAVINYAVGHGIKLIGENRAQELCEKYGDLKIKAGGIHFIGTLQTNKVSQVVGKVCMIESVNSLKLARFISQKSMEKGIVTDVLAEVNIGGEASKTGIDSENLCELLYEISQLKGISVRGLMTIPPISENSDANRRNFSNMYDLFIDIRGKKMDNISMDFLSMGMSQDYCEAIMEGASIVRIGSALFGARKYN